jgi:hypothetical protein
MKTSDFYGTIKYIILISSLFRPNGHGNIPEEFNLHKCGRNFGRGSLLGRTGG